MTVELVVIASTTTTTNDTTHIITTCLFLEIRVSYFRYLCQGYIPYHPSFEPIIAQLLIRRIYGNLESWGCFSPFDGG